VEKLRWEQHQGGDGWAAMLDTRIVAEVVPYGYRTRPYWVGWIHGKERLRGRYITRQEAEIAVEVALHNEPPGDASIPP
jgi:hypothetical protein